MAAGLLHVLNHVIQAITKETTMTTDSPIDYHCPSCKAIPGWACVRPLEAQDIVFFHTSRRAARMQALAKASAHPTARKYRRGNCNHGDVTLEHRVTRIRRPDPTLPFDEPIMNARVAWEAAVKDAVDRIFDSMEAQS